MQSGLDSNAMNINTTAGNNLCFIKNYFFKELFASATVVSSVVNVLALWIPTVLGYCSKFQTQSSVVAANWNWFTRVVSHVSNVFLGAFRQSKTGPVYYSQF